jgi:hypothetical protein
MHQHGHAHTGANSRNPDAETDRNRDSPYRDRHGYQHAHRVVLWDVDGPRDRDCITIAHADTAANRDSHMRADPYDASRLPMRFRNVPWGVCQVWAPWTMPSGIRRRLRLLPSDSHRVADGHLYYQDADATRGNHHTEAPLHKNNHSNAQYARSADTHAALCTYRHSILQR